MSKKVREKAAIKVEDLKPIELELLSINADVEVIAKNLNLPRDVVAQLLLQREIVILNRQIGELLRVMLKRSDVE